jgi:hypothetical protein
VEIQTYSTDLHLYLYSYIHPVPLRMPLEYSLWVAAPRKAEARNTSKTPNSKLQTPNSKLRNTSRILGTCIFFFSSDSRAASKGQGQSGVFVWGFGASDAQ